MKKNLKKVHQVRSVRETYEWWREQETNEYETNTDYLYTPDYVVSINDLYSLDRPRP